MKGNNMESEEKIKQKLLSRGFTKDQLLNNMGLIDATIKEVIMEACKIMATYGIKFTSPTFRDATDAEKEELFSALEKDGKRWNPEKKIIEDIPQEPKIGDLVIAWNVEEEAIIGRVNEITYNKLGRIGYYMISGYGFCFAVKFKSMEQYYEIRGGK